MTTKYQKAKHHARNMQLSQRQMRARMREMEKELSELRAKAEAQAVSFSDIEGAYFCRCVSCEKDFISNNKRATTCFSCLLPAQVVSLNALPGQCLADIYESSADWDEFAQRLIEMHATPKLEQQK